MIVFVFDFLVSSSLFFMLTRFNIATIVLDSHHRPRKRIDFHIVIFLVGQISPPPRNTIVHKILTKDSSSEQFDRIIKQAKPG
jgi:hypothetical protein